MKHTIFIFFLIFSFSGLSQNQPTFKTGVDYGLYRSGNLGYSNYRLISKPGLFLEKPINLTLFNCKSFIISPGLAYSSIKENVFHSRSSNSYNREIKHNMISGSFKLIHTTTIINSDLNFYYGIFSGIRIFSQSKGTIDWAIYTPFETRKFTEKVETTKSDFYNQLYGGMLIGFEQAKNSNQLLNPGLEIKYIPAFGKLENDEYKKSFGGLLFSLHVAIGTKKAAQK
jgi:hypothetical protein